MFCIGDYVRVKPEVTVEALSLVRFSSGIDKSKIFRIDDLSVVGCLGLEGMDVLFPRIFFEEAPEDLIVDFTNVTGRNLINCVYKDMGLFLDGHLIEKIKKCEDKLIITFYGESTFEFKAPEGVTDEDELLAYALNKYIAFLAREWENENGQD